MADIGGEEGSPVAAASSGGRTAEEEGRMEVQESVLTWSDLAEEYPQLFPLWQEVEEMNQRLELMRENLSNPAEGDLRGPLIQLEQELEATKRRLDAMKEPYIKKTKGLFKKLRLDRLEAWGALEGIAEWESETILTLLKGHWYNLPSDYFNPSVWKKHAPAHLVQNEEVIRTWIGRPIERTGGIWCPPLEVRQSIPESILGDLPLLLNAVSKWPYHTLKFIPPTILQEHIIAFFEAFLRSEAGKFRGFGHDEDEDENRCLQRFFATETIRNNAELMIQLFTKPSWPLKEKDMSPTLLGPSLRHDENFCLRLATTLANLRWERFKNRFNFGSNTAGYYPTCPANLLICFSRKVRRNKEVVLAICQANGENLQYANESFRQQEEIVRAATRYDHMAFRHVLPGNEAHDNLCTDHEFLQELFQQKSGRHKSKDDVCTLFKSLVQARLSILQPEATSESNLMDDPSKQKVAWDLCCFAIQAGYTEIPHHIAQTSEFWKHFVAQQQLPCPDHSGAEGPLEIPPDFRNDADIILPYLYRSAKAGKRIDSTLVSDLFSEEPRFLNDPRCILPLLVYCQNQFEHFRGLVPARFWTDKNFMLETLGQSNGGFGVRLPMNSSSLRWFSEDLLEDEEVLKAAFNAWGVRALEFIPRFIQLQFPETVAQVIQWSSLRVHHPVELLGWIPGDLFAHRSVCMAWVKAGGTYLVQSLFHEERLRDQELFLEVCRHNHWRDYFQFADESMLSDRSFLKKAVSINCRVLQFGRGGLSHDLELATIAFANQHPFVENRADFVVHGYSEWSTIGSPDFTFLVELARYLRDVIQNSEAFQHFVLGVRHCMPNGKDTDTDIGSCPAGLLHAGHETSQALTGKIAGFVGIAQGEKLKQLRGASSHLALFGF